MPTWTIRLSIGLTQRFIFATDSLIKNEKICESVAYCGFLRKSYTE